MGDNTIENKVWKTIRRKKFFIFSELMLVTGATQNYLVQLLAEYEAKEYIVLQAGKRISDRQYRVIKVLDKELGKIRIRKERSNPIKSFSDLFESLPQNGTVSYNNLFQKSNLLGGVFKKMIKIFLKIGLIKQVQEEYVLERYYKGDYEVVSEEYIKIKQLIDSKNIAAIQVLIEKSNTLKAPDLNHKRKKVDIEPFYNPIPKPVPKTAAQKKNEKIIDYKKSSDYKRKLKRIVEFAEAHGRPELQAKAGVSKGTISLVLADKYPNPKKMIDHIYKKISSEIIGADTTADLGELAKELGCI